MSERPTIQFLSLFVPDLRDARERYRKVFGIEPEEQDTVCPSPHPFAAAGPVVFDLGTVRIALYQCDLQGTHPGDVGIGLSDPSGPEEVTARARQAGARVFPKPGPALTVFMMPDRHFFELKQRFTPE